MKGSDLLVSALENEGVERIFGVPGEENLDVVESLRRSSIKLIVTRHEQAASFMAATQGRLTGRPGVCLATLGPGALNLTTGAAFALLGAMPMVMITGQKGVLSRKQGRFQVVDIVATMAPLTKMARQIVSPATIPTTVREAFRLAQQERPGPVHLELPEDIAGEEVPEIPLVKLHPIDIPVADSAALDRAADLILKAERPLVMLGAAASRPRLAGPTPQQIVHDVRQVMPEDGIVCLDNGMYKIWFARNYRTHVANTLLLDNALATMGAGLPAAIAVAILHPRRRVLAVCGDGGFMMNSQEMETAVRLRLNVVVLVLQDNAYGMIRWKQQADGFPDFGMTFGNPDFAAYARAHYAKGTQVETADGLVPALEAAFREGGVHLIAAPIDYSENIKVLVDELRSAALDR